MKKAVFENFSGSALTLLSSSAQVRERFHVHTIDELMALLLLQVQC